ncbi:MAG: TnsA endonuclease N-terminal domain-containing protein [Devosia sp.]|nr:TnsA endonuclease N-terminal domain-containing protein [Devosia sp.]
MTTFTDAGAVVTSQPVTLYFDAGDARRRYTPDFLVAWSDGRQTLVEVKYRADLRARWAALRPGFAAARTWAREHGATFRIVTESSVRGPRLVNAKRLIPLRAAPLDPTICQTVLSTARSLTAPTLGRLVEALPLERAQALSAVWRMLAHGLLAADMADVLNPQTPVSAP